MSWMRSIWVSIRAVNYTDRATRQVGRNIDYLIRKQNEMRRAAVTMMAAGLMWTAMGGLAFMAIGKIIEKSAEGRRAIHIFGRATDRMLKALGTAFIKAAGPAIKMLTGLFNAIAQLDPNDTQRAYNGGEGSNRLPYSKPKHKCDGD